MTTTVRPVILSGGSGTRLWPLSRKLVPKQFVDLVGRTLFELSLHRLDGVAGAGAPIVVTGASYLEMVTDALTQTVLPDYLIIAEPVGRNTAPAVLAAALMAEPDEVLVVLPSDHLIRDEDDFREAVRVATSMAGEGHLVTFGVTPDRPETGFGYIEAGEDLGESKKLVRFVEKPPLEVAERIWNDGNHLWNSGMFVFQAQAVISEAEKLRPGLVAAVRAVLPRDKAKSVRLLDGFADVESISIDYAVMEHTTQGVVIPIDVGWTDVGSYQTLLDLSERDESGNVALGDVTLLNVSNSYIRGESRKVVVGELNGVVVVETADSVLVVPIEHSQIVRDLVGLLDDRHR